MVVLRTQQHFAGGHPLASGFKGDVSSLQAWEILKSDETAVLVDVRTPAEWMFVGEPDISVLNKEVVRIPWRLYPSFMVNSEFAEMFAKENIPHEAPVLFICRSGGRSTDAAIAMAQQGWQNCYNIEGGFEGDPNAEGHRSTTSGWKFSGLSWGQK